MYKIERFRSEKNKEYYFRGVAKNGQTVFPSEGYKNKADRDKIADRLTGALDVPFSIGQESSERTIGDKPDIQPKGYVVARLVEPTEDE